MDICVRKMKRKTRQRGRGRITMYAGRHRDALMYRGKADEIETMRERIVHVMRSARTRDKRTNVCILTEVPRDKDNAGHQDSDGGGGGDEGGVVGWMGGMRL